MTPSRGRFSLVTLPVAAAATRFALMGDLRGAAFAECPCGMTSPPGISPRDWAAKHTCPPVEMVALSHRAQRLEACGV